MDLELNNDQDDAFESKAQCALVASCSSTGGKDEASQAAADAMGARAGEKVTGQGKGAT